MEPLFVVVRHASVSMHIFEVDAVETTIGRDPDSGIWLTDVAVSRKHAVLFIIENRWFIRDLGSRNGINLKGRRSDSNEPLRDGSGIDIGPYLLTICFDISAAIRLTVDADASTQPEQDLATAERDAELKLQSLTPARRRVYDLFMEGLSDKEVASRLDISKHTVHEHAKAIYLSLSVSSRPELMAQFATRRVRGTMGRR